MKKFLIYLFIISTFSSMGSIYAQDNEEIINGFIKNVKINNENISISIIDNFGNQFDLDITTSTEIGIETQSGERWVGNISDSQNYVLKLLEEAQHSLEPITVTYSDKSINTLVSYEASNIKNNLGYLAGSFIFLSVLFFGYIFIINNKIKIISTKK